jgi:membrane-bound serine protease (ClpP class)
MKIKILLTFILALATQFSINAEEQLYQVNSVLQLEIDSSINPGIKNYLEYNIKKHPQVDAYLVTMNTPGGLLSTTKDIMTLFAKTNKPLYLWVGPSGASATSAGAIIASASDFLYMAEGTNIGAATPISTTGDIDKKSDMRAKAVNDIKALVKAQAQMHNRNGGPFAKMIDEAASFTYQDAHKLNFINGIRNTSKQALLASQGETFSRNSVDYKININSAVKIIEAKMDMGQKLLSILSSPNLAYILFLAGLALLYLELQAPGGFLAGSIGVVCLVTAAISFQVLPLNLGALALIVLSFVLYILEIYITSFGILSLAATASLIAGSLFLFRTNDSYLSVSMSLILSVVGAVICFIGIIVYVFMKTKKNIGASKFNELTLETGEVLEVHEQGTYSIKSHGEYWKAKSDDKLQIGDTVKVIKKNKDMTLEIKKAGE